MSGAACRFRPRSAIFWAARQAACSPDASSSGCARCGCAVPSPCSSCTAASGLCCCCERVRGWSADRRAERLRHRRRLAAAALADARAGYAAVYRRGHQSAVFPRLRPGRARLSPEKPSHRPRRGQILRAVRRDDLAPRLVCRRRDGHLPAPAAVRRAAALYRRKRIVYKTEKSGNRPEAFLV